MARQIKADLVVKDKATKNIKKVEKQTTTSFNKMKSSADGLATAWKGALPLAVFAAASIAVYKLAGAVKELAAEGDRLDKLTTNLNISTQAIQELEYAAERSGISVEQFDKSLQTMSRRIAFATRDTGAANAAFKALGINVDKLNKLSADKQLKFIADRMNEVANESDRAAYNFEIFGLSGTKMNAMLKDGSEGIKQLQTDAQNLGFVLSEEAITNSAEYTDAVLDLDEAFKGLKTTIIEDALPQLTTLLKVLTNITQALADSTRGFSTKIPDTIEGVNKKIKKTQKILDSYAESPFWTKVRNILTEDDIARMRDLIKKLEAAKERLENTHVSKMFKIGPRPKIKQSTGGDKDTELSKQIEDINVNALKRIATLKGSIYERELTLIAEKYKKEKTLLINNQISTITLDKAFHDEVVALTQNEADRIMKINNKRKQLEEDLQCQLLEIKGNSQQADVAAENLRYERFKETNGFIQEAYDIHKQKLTDINTKYSDIDYNLQQQEIARFTALDDEATAKREAAAEAAFEKKREITEQYAGILESNMGNAFASMIDGSKNAEEAFADMASGIIADLTRLILKMIIYKTIASAVGYNVGGFSGWGAAEGGVAQGGFTPFASSGVVTKPTAGLVGEGMYNEAIVPLPNGKAIPVDMKGQTGTTIVNNINVESSGGDASKDREQAHMIATAIDIKIRQSLIKEQRPGGLIHGGNR